MTPFATFAEVIGFGALAVSASTFWIMLVTRKQARWKETRAEWERRYTGIQQQHEVTTTWLAALDKDLAVVKTQMAVFWKGLSVSSAAALHSPHTPAFDRLIEKYEGTALNEAELVEFRQHLIAIVLDPAETPVRKYLAQMTLLSLRALYVLGEDLATLPPTAYAPQTLYGDTDALARAVQQVAPETRQP